MKKNKIINTVIPSYCNRKANKELRKKIKDRNTAAVTDDLNNNNLLEIYRTEIFERKDKLEDKAKTNTVGVTIAVTLMMNAKSFINGVPQQYPCPIVGYLMISLFVLSIMYMISAGLNAIHLIAEENEVFILQGKQEESDCFIKQKIGLNRLKNIIRNNYLFTSYSCIRNALICLFAVMLMMVVPIKLETDNPVTDGKAIYYSETSMDDLQKMNISYEYVTEIIRNKNLPKEETLTIVDDNKRIAIQIYSNEELIYVNNLEKYIPTKKDG